VVLTEVHDVVPADGAIVDDNVPGPERHGIPLTDPSIVSRRTGRASLARARGRVYLLDLEALLALLGLAVGTTLLLGHGRRSGRIGHVDIGHGDGVVLGDDWGGRSGRWLDFGGGSLGGFKLMGRTGFGTDDLSDRSRRILCPGLPGASCLAVS